MEAKLNFVNQSNSASDVEVIIAPSASADAIAWIVIKNCGKGDNHPFVFPFDFQICAADSFGNYTPRMDADTGQQFAMVTKASGDVLEYKGKSTNPAAVEIVNDLAKGAINALTYKDGKLYEQKSNLAPAQKAAFDPKPGIYIGVADQACEGEVVPAGFNGTTLSLLGIANADIVMSGGGPSGSDTPYLFKLENVVLT